MLHKSHQKTSFKVFLAELTALGASVFELEGMPEPEDAQEMRERHRRIVQVVGAYITRDLTALRQFTGAPICSTVPETVLREDWEGFILPEFNTAEEFVVETGEFDKPSSDPFAEHRLSARQLGVGGH